jgi:PST family polysaccharide transporter
MAVGDLDIGALVVDNRLPAVNTALMWAIAAWIPAGQPRSGYSLMLRFEANITQNILVVYIAYNFDKLLLGRFGGADALGVYGRANQLIDVPTSISSRQLAGSRFLRCHDSRMTPPVLGATS